MAVTSEEFPAALKPEEPDYEAAAELGTEALPISQDRQGRQQGWLRRLPTSPASSAPTERPPAMEKATKE